MTNFGKWLVYTGLSIREAAELLGFHRNRISAFKRGYTTAPQKEPAFPDRRTRFAMAAIAEGLPEWPDDSHEYIKKSEEDIIFTVDKSKEEQESS